MRFNRMEKFLDELIGEFNKQKKKRGSIFNNFVAFVDFSLKNLNDNKYKEMKKNLLKYIILNEKSISLKLVKN